MDLAAAAAALPDHSLAAWARHAEESTWERDHAPHPSVDGPVAEKRYPRFKRWDLGLEPRLLAPAEKRFSCRSFSAQALTADDLRALLASVCATDGRYPFASAGGLYAAEIYVHPLRVEGVPADLTFHLAKSEGALEQLWPNPTLIDNAFPTQRWTAQAALLVLVSARFGPYVDRYGERGYRFALQESGAVAHALAEAAAALELGTCLLGGFRDAALDAALDIGVGRGEQVVCCVAVGHEGG